MNSNETIIFVHGAWHGKWCWDKYWKKTFQNEGYNVVTFDLPEHGIPGRVKGINKLSISDYVDALSKQVAKIDELPILIGHSMGGLIVQKYLERNTAKKAILLASAPPHGVLNTTLKFLTRPYAYPGLLLFDLYQLVNSEYKSRLAFFSDTLEEVQVKEYTSKLCSESYLAFLNMLLPRVKVNENSDIPILVLGAKNDTIFSVKENTSTAKIFDAELIILDDIAHDMMLDTNQNKAATAIINWLK